MANPALLLHTAAGVGMVIERIQRAAYRHQLDIANLQASAEIAARTLALKGVLLARCLDYEKQAHDRRVEAILAIFEANKEFLRAHQAEILRRQQQLSDRYFQETSPAATLHIDAMIRDGEARLRELDTELAALALEAMSIIRSMQFRISPELLERIDRLRAEGPAVVIDQLPGA